jgi:hypothetical protein
MNIPSRRALLGAALALPAVATVPVMASHSAAADAELLAACAELAAVAGLIDEWNDPSSEGVSEERGVEILDRWVAAVDRVAALPPQTGAGRLAKAKAGYLAMMDVRRDSRAFGQNGMGREEWLALVALAQVAGIEPPVYERGDEEGGA